jgi:hypothetical protein
MRKIPLCTEITNCVLGLANGVISYGLSPNTYTTHPYKYFLTFSISSFDKVDQENPSQFLVSL